ncbi:MAG TPA: hypothetical protein VFO25_11765 [Candidatus Eremiobacteraceae bacterium]|nr:hypothetical protein [Candidatus Eremiobacteraceae bacterium]
MNKQLLAILIVIVAILFTRVAPAGASQCTIHRVPNARDLRIDAFYSGVSIAANDVWAVGSAANFKAKETLAEHWDGTSWTIVPTPNYEANKYGPNLYGVAAISSANVWAVGDYFDLTQGAYSTLALHWNGKRWALVLPPNPGQDALLQGVTGIGKSNALWMVGVAGLQSSAFSFIELHDRGSWSVAYATPGYIAGIAALSQKSAFAVGSYTAPTGSSYPLAVHWNGQTWSQMLTTGLPTGGSFSSVSELSDGDVWAVGTVSFDRSVRPLVAHWDGVSWTQVPGPTFHLKYATLNGVLALSRSNVWTAGVTYDRRPFQSTNIVAHWTGLAWTTLRAPEPQTFQSLFGISGQPHALWSFGRAEDSSGSSGKGVTDLSSC